MASNADLAEQVAHLKARVAVMAKTTAALAQCLSDVARRAAERSDALVRVLTAKGLLSADELADAVERAQHEERTRFALVDPEVRAALNELRRALREEIDQEGRT